MKIFSTNKFKQHTNNFDKKLFAPYLKDMEGREAVPDGKYYLVELSDGIIWPVYEEWLEEK